MHSLQSLCLLGFLFVALTYGQIPPGTYRGYVWNSGNATQCEESTLVFFSVTTNNSFETTLLEPLGENKTGSLQLRRGELTLDTGNKTTCHIFVWNAPFLLIFHQSPASENCVNNTIPNSAAEFIEMFCQGNESRVFAELICVEGDCLQRLPEPIVNVPMGTYRGVRIVTNETRQLNETQSSSRQNITGQKCAEPVPSELTLSNETFELMGVMNTSGNVILTGNYIITIDEDNRVHCEVFYWCRPFLRIFGAGPNRTSCLSIMNSIPNSLVDFSDMFCKEGNETSNQTASQSLPRSYLELACQDGDCSENFPSRIEPGTYVGTLRQLNITEGGCAEVDVRFTLNENMTFEAEIGNMTQSGNYTETFAHFLWHVDSGENYCAKLAISGSNITLFGLEPPISCLSVEDIQMPNNLTEFESQFCGEQANVTVDLRFIQLSCESGPCSGETETQPSVVEITASRGVTRVTEAEERSSSSQLAIVSFVVLLAMLMTF